MAQQIHTIRAKIYDKKTADHATVLDIRTECLRIIAKELTLPCTVFTLLCLVIAFG